MTNGRDLAARRNDNVLLFPTRKRRMLPLGRAPSVTALCAAFDALQQRKAALSASEQRESEIRLVEVQQGGILFGLASLIRLRPTNTEQRTALARTLAHLDRQEDADLREELSGIFRRGCSGDSIGRPEIERGQFAQQIGELAAEWAARRQLAEARA